MGSDGISEACEDYAPARSGGGLTPDRRPELPSPGAVVDTAPTSCVAGGLPLSVEDREIRMANHPRIAVGAPGRGLGSVEHHGLVQCTDNVVIG
jgi:hypothetical protein